MVSCRQHRNLQGHQFKKVNARGLEAGLEYKIQLKKILLHVHGNFAYTRSTNESLEISKGESMEGKQLIYIPFYNGNAELEAGFKGFTFCYQHSFTGLRYIQSDNKQSLPEYNLGSIYFGKIFLVHH